MVDTSSNVEMKENDSVKDKNRLHDVPTLRIGLTDKNDSLEFKLTGRFSVISSEGNTLLKNVVTPVKWKIKIEQRSPALYNCTILLGKFINYDEAQDMSYQFIERGVGAKVKTIGGRFYFKDKVLFDNSQYWVVIDNFQTENEARSFASENIGSSRYEIIHDKIQEPRAHIDLFDSDMEKLCEAENVIRLIPESAEMETEIFDYSFTDRSEAIQKNSLTLQGALEFRSTNDGNLLIISELPIENYIGDVVCGVMDDTFPIEALKAVSIIIRSKTYAGLNVTHRNEPFDVCGDWHCNVFQGFSKIPLHTAEAIHDTTGEVLIFDGKIVDSSYSFLCGGITENPTIISSDALQVPETSIHDSINDGGLTFELLVDENSVKKWIEDEPDVCCNPARHSMLTKFRHYFRWEVTYSRAELESIFENCIGFSIGTIFDIIPIRRSISGRLTELEILASNKNLIIKKENNIRNLLPSNILYSSCFYVEKTIDEEGIPLTFTFKGAGNGHGVGLCILGSIALALESHNYKEILNHYFKGIQIKKIH